ncbi:hypothetical protein CALCODRAFT_534095, partial [Calocera cornea HHB12733]
MPAPYSPPEFLRAEINHLPITGPSDVRPSDLAPVWIQGHHVMTGQTEDLHLSFEEYVTLFNILGKMHPDYEAPPIPLVSVGHDLFPMSQAMIAKEHNLPLIAFLDSSYGQEEWDDQAEQLPTPRDSVESEDVDMETASISYLNHNDQNNHVQEIVNEVLEQAYTSFMDTFEEAWDRLKEQVMEDVKARLEAEEQEE